MSAPSGLPAYEFAAVGAAVRVTVAATQACLRVSGALWLDGEGALVVADLHLEKGSAYASRGQLLPPYDTRDALARLAGEIDALNPKVVVMLGDSFHDGEGEARLDQDDARALCALARSRTLVWVSGNHDPRPSASLPGEAVDEIALGGLRLRHEPRSGLAPAEVAGHLHPCARISAGGRSVRRRCFVTDGERLILPAFGAYAGGLNIRDVAFSGLFARPPLAVALGARRAHAVGWRSVRAE